MDETAEFSGWEVLLNATSDSPNAPTVESDDTEGGAIKHDYFSLASTGRYPLRPPESEPGSEESDARSWIDPDTSAASAADNTRQVLDMSFARFGAPNLGSSWSGLSSPQDSEKGDLPAFVYNSEASSEGLGTQFRELDDWIEGSDPGPDREEEEEEEEATGSEGDDGFESREFGGEGVGEKKFVIWWKIPIELLKFCVLKAKPAWTISIAAAIVGVVMLGRRLYKMRHKSGTIPLKLSIDNKRASMFMVQATRLNKVFSVSKRIPLARPPSLPESGSAAPWPTLGFALS